MSVLNGNSFDNYLGVFGLSFQEKISAYMVKILVTNKDGIKLVKNISYINNLYNIYLSGLSAGVALPTMSNFTAMIDHFKTNRVTESIAKAWISAVYFLSQNGSIDLKIYDPFKAKKMIAEKEKITGNPVKIALSNVGMVAKSIRTVAIIGGIAVGLFYINNITKDFKTVKK